MTISSIMKNFLNSREKQVEMFADAMEVSANDRPICVPVAVRFIKRESEPIEFMEKRKKRLDMIGGMGYVSKSE